LHHQRSDSQIYYFIDEEKNFKKMINMYVNNNVQIIYQHNRKFQTESMNDDYYYSQGESDDEETTRGSDLFEDSQPSTDDEEEKLRTDEISADMDGKFIN